MNQIIAFPKILHMCTAQKKPFKTTYANFAFSLLILTIGGFLQDWYSDHSGPKISKIINTP